MYKIVRFNILGRVTTSWKYSIINIRWIWFIKNFLFPPILFIFCSVFILGRKLVIFPGKIFSYRVLVLYLQEGMSSLFSKHNWTSWTHWNTHVPKFTSNLYCICTANMKHALKQMQYRFMVIYETLSKSLAGFLIRKLLQKSQLG